MVDVRRSKTTPIDVAVASGYDYNASTETRARVVDRERQRGVTGNRSHCGNHGGKNERRDSLCHPSWPITRVAVNGLQINPEQSPIARGTGADTRIGQPVSRWKPYLTRRCKIGLLTIYDMCQSGESRRS